MGGGGKGGGVGVYLVHHPLHSFSPEVGGGRLHGNGRLQGTLQYWWQCMRYTVFVDPKVAIVSWLLHIPAACKVDLWDASA